MLITFNQLLSMMFLLTMIHYAMMDIFLMMDFVIREEDITEKTLKNYNEISILNLNKLYFIIYNRDITLNFYFCQKKK
jgi:hypothetical protein